MSSNTLSETVASKLIFAGRVGKDLAKTVDASGMVIGKEMIAKADEQGSWMDLSGATR